MKKTSFETLMQTRLLSSQREVKEFDAALEELSNTQLSESDISQLFTVFIDRTDKEDVMYGLLHLIEESDDKLMITALLAQVPYMENFAPQWLETFIYRILNNEKCRETLTNHLSTAAKTSARDGVIKVLSRIQTNSSEAIKARAKLVLSEVKKT
ncbi:Imm30 family immunity protein [Stenotrophomonas rhizophila]|uniref:Imm30 family immunity protein n=1 Tax=Stenotrophomonas rhizophila TaxID=216778 RepID=UPI0010BFA9D3|nr:Imm30 family immunity protein [Stenotrophomonas rhizophila]TKK09669.1 hypothetical protein SrhCFBP13529_05805 [Stenotrophomonas rhizophila]